MKELEATHAEQAKEREEAWNWLQTHHVKYVICIVIGTVKKSIFINFATIVGIPMYADIHLMLLLIYPLISFILLLLK